MDFGTLKSRLLDLIGRAPNALAYEMVTSEINQRLRIMDMEATATLTVAAAITLADESVTDFLSIESIYLDSTPPRLLTPTSPQLIKSRYVAGQTPNEYAIVDGQLLLDGAGGGDSVVLRYYARQADLSGDSDTNDILTYRPNIYVYGTLYHHAQLIKDYESAATWGGAYERAIKDAIASDARDRMSGPPAKPHPPGMTP